MDIHTLWVADHIAFSTVEHVHDYYQMIYCQKAGGSFEINGMHYDGNVGFVYFIQPMEPHVITRGNNMRLIEIKFIAEDEEAQSRLRKIPSVFSMENDHSFRRMLKDVVNEGHSQALYCNESTNAALELLLLRLLRGFVKDTGETLHTLNFNVQTKNDGSSRRDSDVQFIQLIDYMEKHLSEKITLEDLSELMHFDKSYLIERFKSLWGLPPKQYLNALRLEKAKELLVTTDKTVTDIAQETGFQSIHYFSSFFKRKENMTPLNYRKRYGEPVEPDQL